MGKQPSCLDSVHICSGIRILALQYVSIIHFNVAIDFSVIDNFDIYMLWQGCFCVIGVWLYRHRGFSDVTINSSRLFIGLR